MHKILSIPYIFFFQFAYKITLFRSNFLGYTVVGEYLKFNVNGTRGKFLIIVANVTCYQSATGMPRLYLYSIIS